MNDVPGEFENLSGLEYLRRLVDHWQGSPMSDLMDIRLIEVADGMATIESYPSEKFYNPQKRAHGGYAATLIDSALGSAVQTKLPAGVGYGTIEIKVSYVGKLVAETGRLRCIATVLHAGRTLFTAEAKLIDDAGRMYAHGSGTFLVYPK